jgi:hypothetical protein
LDTLATQETVRTIGYKAQEPNAGMSPNHKKNLPTSTGEDPGIQKFKAEMKKRHCLMCERNFSYDLGIHYQDGYICQACQSGQGPEFDESAKSNPQKTLGDSEAPA